MSPIDMVSTSFFDLWDKFIGFLPILVGALLVFIVGLIIAGILGKIAERIIKAIKVDQLVEKMKIGDRFFKDIGIQLSVSKFFGEVVKWFLILVFLMAATNILGLITVSEFLNQIVLYLPNVIVAIIILSIAFLLGNFIHSAVRHSTKAAGVMSASFLAVVAKWSVIITGLLAALIQLRIAEAMLNTVFIGFVAALSLAIGLAFGLGGKEEAALILRKIREEIEEKN